MDKDKQRLLQKLYECMDMCDEQGLHHEHSLLNMTAGCIEADLTLDALHELSNEAEEVKTNSRLKNSKNK